MLSTLDTRKLGIRNPKPENRVHCVKSLRSSYTELYPNSGHPTRGCIPRGTWSFSSFPRSSLSHVLVPENRVPEDCQIHAITRTKGRGKFPKSGYPKRETRKPGTWSCSSFPRSSLSHVFSESSQCRSLRARPCRRNALRRERATHTTGSEPFALHAPPPYTGLYRGIGQASSHVLSEPSQRRSLRARPCRAISEEGSYLRLIDFCVIQL